MVARYYVDLNGFICQYGDDTSLKKLKYSRNKEGKEMGQFFFNWNKKKRY